MTRPWPRLSRRSAAQLSASGQAAQLGFAFGTHTVAPSSIMAWLKSPGRPGSSRAAAAAVSRGCMAGGGSGQASSRASTLATLPSSTGTAWPQAWDAMAAAV